MAVTMYLEGRVSEDGQRVSLPLSSCAVLLVVTYTHPPSFHLTFVHADPSPTHCGAPWVSLPRSGLCSLAPQFVARRSVPVLVRQVQLPAALDSAARLVRSGLCVVVRHLVRVAHAACPAQGLLQLLGFRQGSLRMCAEVSGWTKLCEVELPHSVATLVHHIHSLSHQQSGARGQVTLPEDLLRLEDHLGKPVKLHNDDRCRRQELASLQADLCDPQHRADIVSGSRLEGGRFELQRSKPLPHGWKRFTVHAGGVEGQGTGEHPSSGATHSEVTQAQVCEVIRSLTYLDIHFVHLYSEGMEMTIADLCLFSYLYFLLESVEFQTSQLTGHLPRVTAWLSHMTSLPRLRHAASCCAFHLPPLPLPPPHLPPLPLSPGNCTPQGGTEKSPAEGGTEKRGAEGGTEKSGAEGGTEKSGAEGGTEKSGAEGGTEKRGAEGGTEKRGAEGGTEKSGAEGGTEKRGAEGGTEKSGAEGETEKSGAEGGTEKRGAEGGTEKSGAEGGTEKRGAEGGTEKSGAEGGTEKSSAEGGTEKSGAEGGTEKSGAEGGTEKSGAEGGTEKSGAEGGTEKSGAEGGSEKGSEWISFCKPAMEDVMEDDMELSRRCRTKHRALKPEVQHALSSMKVSDTALGQGDRWCVQCRGLDPKVGHHPRGSEVGLDWDSLPSAVHPREGEVPTKRVHRKCQQLQNLVTAVLEVARPGDVIVDFCSGGGHLGLAIAHLLPRSTVYLVENKEESLLRAHSRMDALPSKNVILYQCNMDYFVGRFDVGVCLHACGSATDMVLQHCLSNHAAFVICPCCYGSIQRTHLLTYPRSRLYRDRQVTYKEFLTLGHAADQTEFNIALEQQGRQCMNLVDSDRAHLAREAGYTVTLTSLQPLTCSPKNNLLIGYKPSAVAASSDCVVVDVFSDCVVVDVFSDCVVDVFSGCVVVDVFSDCVVVDVFSDCVVVAVFSDCVVAVFSDCVVDVFSDVLWWMCSVMCCGGCVQ
ncbi:hypothetical protein ACOMHN_028622 [Nucella lapillus]